MSVVPAAFYVFATGQTHSVREVVEKAFSTLNLDWQRHVKLDSRLLRPTEPMHLMGNPAKAKLQLNWEPRMTFTQMIEEMTLAEVKALSHG